MKRIILIFAAILLLLPAAEAQYSQGVLTETTTVTRTKIEKPKKERQKFDAKRGYQQEASIGWWWTCTEYSSLRAAYIGGMRFNNYLYAGIGVGLDVRTVTYDQDYTANKDSRLYLCNGSENAELPMQLIAVPLFANFKAYLTKTKVVPYCSFSAGARFSTPRKFDFYDNKELEYTQNYGAIKPFFDLAIGVSYRLLNNKTVVLQCGYYLQNVAYFTGWFSSTGNTYDNCIYGDWEKGLSVSIGMTF